MLLWVLGLGSESVAREFLISCFGLPAIFAGNPNWIGVMLFTSFFQYHQPNIIDTQSKQTNAYANIHTQTNTPHQLMTTHTSQQQHRSPLLPQNTPFRRWRWLGHRQHRALLQAPARLLRNLLPRLHKEHQVSDLQGDNLSHGRLTHCLKQLTRHTQLVQSLPQRAS